MTQDAVQDKPHHIVIVGGGFGGLFAAKVLGKKSNNNVKVTLLDKRNFHLFQPLLYQVATGSLVVGDIATPHRVLLRKQENVQPLMATAYDLDVENRRVLHEFGEVQYDTLIVATGVKHSYFGRDEWRDHAPGLKTVEHALEMRRKIFTAFERAEHETDPIKRRALLTFVVVGAGPTGVELAGALGELAHHTMVNDFRSIDPREARILLVEGAEDVLPVYDEDLRASARQMLEELGVKVITETLVENIEADQVTMRSGQLVRNVPAATVLWAAGVRASVFGQVLSERTGVELDRAGKVPVQSDLTLPGYPEIFVIGDLARYEPKPGQPLPGLAPVAIQQGRHVAKQLLRRLRGKEFKPFKYKDRGSMAVIGRNRAVGDLRWTHVKGFPAWLLWVGIHIWSLMSPQQRLRVMLEWSWKYVTRKSSSRLATGKPTSTIHLRKERMQASGSDKNG
ncbi:MAG: NAD(P)/FAD-dependent oxidoreductase [Salinisphaeraceae bacterium]|nr:NAD(P)/FAD-dependent oxidoreductase [Salinisphaeraceae bacterium]